MKIVRYFVNEEPSEFGRSDHIGFIPMWIPKAGGFDPIASVSGMLHDMFEHSLSDRGRFTDELMAYGRIIAVRVESGVLRGGLRNPDIGSDLGEELYYALEDVLTSTDKYTEDIITQAPRVTIQLEACTNRTISSACRAFASCAKKHESQFKNPVVNDVIMARLANWLKLGYIDARRRYGCKVDNVGYAFEQYANDKRLKNFEDAPQGSVLRACFDTDDNDLKFRLYQPNYEYGQLPRWARLRVYHWRTARV